MAASCRPIALTLTSLIAGAVATTPALAQSAEPYVWELPIEGRGCGGFSCESGSIHLFEYSGRQLYEVSQDGRLVPHEDVKGMFVVDVAVIDGAPIYCSRDRVFRKVRGKVEVNPVPGAEKLISITANDEEVFLLDAPPKSAIIVLNKTNSQVVRTLKYDGRNPLDLAAGDGHLWALDVGDRCIHRVDTQTGRTTLRIQAGPGVEQGTNGLFFRDGKLYVHEADYSRLRRVDWEEDGAAVWSWSYNLHMTFVQESRNEHERDTSTVTFKVPIPMNRATQTVGEITWSQKPSQVFEDRFGHPARLPRGEAAAQQCRSHRADSKCRKVLGRQTAEVRPRREPPNYPPAIDATTRNGSFPCATASGSGASSGSCEMSCSQA